MPEQEKVNEKRSFQTSDITLINREKLTMTGVEKVFEANENKVQLCAAGDNICVTGTGLNVTRLDVENGLLEVMGVVGEIKYTAINTKQGFLKRLFK